ncbi:50S ribosomal protein L25 [Candidatus Hartigia pinicola]|nr:50S ribosomal protein L25 [Candidatus Hartigia pinicola]
MMLTINAVLRKEQGKGASRRLRRKNQFPAIVYGVNKKAISITLNHNDTINKEGKDEFYKVLNLVIDGQEMKVKVQAVQRHPFKPKVTHIDFLCV